MKMRLRIALLYFVIQLHTSYPQELIYFSYISNHVHHLTARLCFFVKWCTSDAFKRYNIVILFWVTFVSSQVDGQTLLLGEMVHL